MTDLAKLKNKIENTPELTALEHDYDAISDSLNTASLIDNPDPQGTVLKSAVLAHLFALLAQQEKASLVAPTVFATFAEGIYANTDLSAATITKLDMVQASILTSGVVTGTKTVGQVINELLEVGNHSAVTSFCDVLKDIGMISAETHEAISARLQETIPDPTWQTQVEGPSWAAENGFEEVTPEHVQSALLLP